ncbi:oxidative stress-responsive serine-rich protein 1 isoform X1 [Pogona vitticeps]
MISSRQLRNMSELNPSRASKHQRSSAEKGAVSNLQGERECSGCSLTMVEIEENLQAAFKKLRVDSEGSSGSPVNEGAPTRTLAKTSDETKGKSVFASKDSWHWCLKKTLRGTMRLQRRRRSKSPVLHPPKFIHCTTKMQKNPVDISDSSGVLGVSSTKEFSKNEQASHSFNDTGVKQTSVMPSGTSMVGVMKNAPENGPANILRTSILKAKNLSDFQTVSEQNKRGLCACVDEACQCKQWQDMKVYMFSGLQNTPQSTPERIVHVQNSSQTLPSRAPSSSLRSCSEQARAHVDDVTIEDLSGYMENFLYIPKKMSHMAEMMYT